MCGTQIAEDKSRMAGGSELARGMAYKKQLEEEYRMAVGKLKKGRGILVTHTNFI